MVWTDHVDADVAEVGDQLWTRARRDEYSPGGGVGEAAKVEQLPDGGAQTVARDGAFGFNEFGGGLIPEDAVEVRSYKA